MLKTSTVCSAAALVALAAPSFAQPPGITMEQINTTLPLEGAPLAVAGRYQVTSGAAFGAPGFMVFHPSSLDAFPSRDTMPVLVWGNGGCAINTARYSGFLSTIASHGFIVLGTAAQEGEQRRQATADDLRAGIEWAFAENARDGSPLRGKIDTNQVAVMGQSCGGFLSLSLGADPRVDTIGMFNSGVQPPNPNAPAGRFPTTDAIKDLHGPVLLINGAERDFLTPASHATYEAITHVPAFYGARENAGHTATVLHPGGGEYANVAANWLRWHFKKDSDAAKMFVGDDCSLCTNPTWDVESKGFGE
jgi:dienelactone hydrolase